MKKRNIVIRCFVLLMLITALMACASTRTHESAGEYVDDSAITTKVKSQLAGDDFFKSFQISVETYKGIVQLSHVLGYLQEPTPEELRIGGPRRVRAGE